MNDLAIGLSTFNPEKEMMQDTFQQELRSALHQINERLNRLSTQVQKIETGENDMPFPCISSTIQTIVSPKLSSSVHEQINPTSQDMNYRLSQIQILKSQNSICRALTIDNQKKIPYQYFDMPRKTQEISINSYQKQINDIDVITPIPKAMFQTFENEGFTQIKRPSSSHQNLKRTTVRMPQYSQHQLRQVSISDQNLQDSIPKLNLTHIPQHATYQKNKLSSQKKEQILAHPKDQRFQLKENRHEARWTQSENQVKNLQCQQRLYTIPQKLIQTPQRIHTNHDNSFLAQNQSFGERLQYHTPIKQMQSNQIKSVSPIGILKSKNQPTSISFLPISQVYRPNISTQQNIQYAQPHFRSSSTQNRIHAQSQVRGRLSSIHRIY